MIFVTQKPISLIIKNITPIGVDEWKIMIKAPSTFFRFITAKCETM